MQQLGFRECHLFDFQIFLGRFTLHEVRGERVRTSHETQHGRLGSNLLPQRAQRLGHERSRRRRIDKVHLLHVLVRSHRLDHRSHLLVDIELHSHTRQRRQNIAEENASVRLVIPPWLERYLDGDLGNFGTFAKRGVLFAEVAVFRDVTSGLTHHPDGDAFGFLAAGGADEEGVDIFAGGIGVSLGHGGGFGGGGEGFDGGWCR
mmetsp:Transcript_6963/g.13267  ORF Transcript_6963/g.13267 Transcript_6963/m.13267 type:complete len:204 (+) Transcript_6963:328-939(+)